MSDEISDYVVEEERGKAFVVAALIFSIIFPPLGLILGIYELIKGRNHPNIRNLAILAIIFSIISLCFYTYSYLDYNDFKDHFHRHKSIN